MSKYNPGDTITIKDTEFAVLDVQKGSAGGGKDKLFILLKEPVGNTPFSSVGGDNYEQSEIIREVLLWFDGFFKDGYGIDKVYERQLDLNLLNGRFAYPIISVFAAPLTFDEYRKYSPYIPLCSGTSWLATGCGMPNAVPTNCVLTLQYNNNINFCLSTLFHSIRPAMQGTKPSGIQSRCRPGVGCCQDCTISSTGRQPWRACLTASAVSLLSGMSSAEKLSGRVKSKNSQSL